MLLVNNANVDVEAALERFDLVIAGQRGEWADLSCPFHPEGDPSFSVNLTHGGWVDRHDGAKGNLVGLVMRLRGCGHREAIDLISKAAPMVPDVDALFLALVGTRDRDEMLIKDELLTWGKEYDALPHGRTARWALKRGFTWPTLKRFGVRFDRERRQLVWPVRDEAGNILGYVARRLPGQAGPKYQYPRGFRRPLFPLDHFDADTAVLVEGPLDAMWLYQRGRHDVLAILGSDLTRDQERWLQANVSGVTLLFDNDAAGRRVTKQLAVRLADKLRVSVGTLPTHVKDPQEVGEDEEVMVGTSDVVTYLMKEADDQRRYPA